MRRPSAAEFQPAQAGDLEFGAPGLMSGERITMIASATLKADTGWTQRTAGAPSG